MVECEICKKKIKFGSYCNECEKEGTRRIEEVCKNKPYECEHCHSIENLYDTMFGRYCLKCWNMYKGLTDTIIDFNEDGR